MRCDGCHQDVAITLVVTDRRGESHLCWRCWKPQPAAVRTTRGKR